MSDRNQRLIAYRSEKPTPGSILAELFGLGANAVRKIGVNAHQQIDIAALEEAISANRAAGHLPFLVVGTAGTTSTGAIDPLPELAALCRKYALWFHVDGAYGAPAHGLTRCPRRLAWLAGAADSIALDPHKWLYSPLEAGCALVRDPHLLQATFSHHPTYYNFNGSRKCATQLPRVWPPKFTQLHALKVWLGLRQVGRAGYSQMIGDDIALAQALYLTRQFARIRKLQAVTQHLSITTFRFVPLGSTRNNRQVAAYVNKLNEELLNRLQKSGEAFVECRGRRQLSLHALASSTSGTTLADVEALPALVLRLGRQVDAEIRPHFLPYHA